MLRSTDAEYLLNHLPIKKENNADGWRSKETCSAARLHELVVVLQVGDASFMAGQPMQHTVRVTSQIECHSLLKILGYKTAITDNPYMQRRIYMLKRHRTNRATKMKLL